MSEISDEQFRRILYELTVVGDAWLDENLESIDRVVTETTKEGRKRHIERHPVSRRRVLMRSLSRLLHRKQWPYRVYQEGVVYGIDREGQTEW